MNYNFYVLKFIVNGLIGEVHEKKQFQHTIFGFSYRIDSHLQKELKTSFIFFRQALSLIWKRHQNKTIISTEKIIYDIDPKTKESTTSYFKNIFKSPPQFFLFRNDLPNFLDTLEKLLSSIIVSLISVSSFMYYLLKKRNSLSILAVEYVENLLLVKALQRMSVKNLFILSSYEKDILFLCGYLSRAQIDTHLFPSSNPIKLFYQNVHTFKFWFSAPFQIKEALVLKENWNVKEFGLVPPYDFQYIKKHQIGAKYPYKLGVISSGMGYRKSIGYPLLNENEYIAEQELHKSIKEIISSGRISIKEMIIFLHPKEKDKDSFEKVKSYYKSSLGFEPNFGPIDKPTRECFNLAELGLATLSTAQMERLFGGYKTLFAPLSILENPYSDDRIEKISAENYSELVALMEKSLNFSEDEFFNEFDLYDYHYSKFPNLPISIDEKIEI